MTEQDLAVPREWTRLAFQLDQVAEVTRECLSLPRASDSLAAGDLAQDEEFAALPYESPLMETVLSPLHFLGSSADHLTALAGVIRTPMTVMATLTLLRTQLVGAAYARYLADPSVDTRERVRRAMNVQLESLAEKMNLFGRDERAEYEDAKKRRERIIAAARGFHWQVNAPSPDAAWPKLWWIGNRPPREGALIASAIALEDESRLGHFLYRWLSSVSHVQPHGLLSLINTQQAVSLGDGSSSAPVSMDHRTLTTFALAAVGSLTAAMDNCVSYYGWRPELWRTRALPVFNTLRSALRIPPGGAAI